MISIRPVFPAATAAPAGTELGNVMFVGDSITHGVNSAPRGLRFSLDCPASRPCALFRSELDRAVLNLLDNAARFTPAGGAVRLSAYVEGDVLTVAVEDSGPGFSPEALARAGRGFYTGDASRPREGHMGMGLTFARQTARRHGGTLELSNTGRGARAALTLPL